MLSPCPCVVNILLMPIPASPPPLLPLSGVEAMLTTTIFCVAGATVGVPVEDTTLSRVGAGLGATGGVGNTLGGWLVVADAGRACDDTITYFC